MKRKLILLDLVLLAAIGAAVWRLRQNWVEAREREQALLNRRVKPLALPPVFKAPRVEPVAAAGYADIALKMLFSKDRNPTVVVEAKPAPPPKPMPPLPVLYGVMNLVDSTTVIMGEKAGAKHLEGMVSRGQPGHARGRGMLPARLRGLAGGSAGAETGNGRATGRGL